MPLTSVIKSIQQGTISLTNPNLTGTATITSVNTAKSVVLFNGTIGNDVVSTDLAYLALTNATTVTATRAVAGAGITNTSAFTVVEYF